MKNSTASACFSFVCKAFNPGSLDVGKAVGLQGMNN